MARINRRPAGSQQRKQSRLWPLQTKGYLGVALCRDLLEIGIPRFAGINAQLLGRLAGQQIPGAFDVIGSERLAVVPFDPLTQREGQLHAVLTPRPTRGQVRHNRLQAGLRYILLIHDQIVKDVHHWLFGSTRRFLEDRHAGRAVKVRESENTSLFLGKRRITTRQRDQHSADSRQSSNLRKHSFYPLAGDNRLGQGGRYLSSQTSSKRHSL